MIEEYLKDIKEISIENKTNETIDNFKSDILSLGSLIPEQSFRTLTEMYFYNRELINVSNTKIEKIVKTTTYNLNDNTQDTASTIQYSFQTRLQFDIITSITTILIINNTIEDYTQVNDFINKHFKTV